MKKWLMPATLALLLSGTLVATFARSEYLIPWIWMAIIVPVGDIVDFYQRQLRISEVH